MISLDNIRAFVRAVELGSFSAAARSLRLSAAVVSHRIRSLEKDSGCRLFNRTTRKMALTEQGRVFYEHCLDVCRAVERAEASVSEKGAAPRGLLKVAAPIGFGQRVVAPMAPRFQEAYPEIDVFLRLSDYSVDLLTEAVDVAVRMEVLADSSLIVRKIADVERILCASPDYIAANGAPKSIAELERHRCLILRYPGARQSRWTLTRNGRPVSAPVSGRLDADAGDVLTRWALEGHGVAIKPVFEIAEHLRAGALVPVLPDHPPQPVTLAILHAYQRMAPPKVRAFADALTSVARDHIAEQLALARAPRKKSGQGAKKRA